MAGDITPVTESLCGQEPLWQVILPPVIGSLRGYVVLPLWLSLLGWLCVYSDDCDVYVRKFA